MTAIKKKDLKKKEIAHISGDMEAKCIAIGSINMYDLFPKSRFGTDTGVIFDCSKTRLSDIKRDTVSSSEDNKDDLLIGLGSKRTVERLFPSLNKLVLK